MPTAAPTLPITEPDTPVKIDPRPNPFFDPQVWPHKICPTQRRDAAR